MNAVMELSGQEYVDVHGTVAKAALEKGKSLPASGWSSSRRRPSNAAGPCPRTGRRRFRQSRM